MRPSSEAALLWSQQGSSPIKSRGRVSAIPGGRLQTKSAAALLCTLISPSRCHLSVTFSAADIMGLRCWEPSPLSVEVDVPDHWANGLPRAKRLSPCAWIGIPAGKTVVGPAGRAAGNPGTLTSQDPLGTWNAAGRRSTGVVAAVSQCIACLLYTSFRT